MGQSGENHMQNLWQSCSTSFKVEARSKNTHMESQLYFMFYTCSPTFFLGTGKSLSDALIFASTNPQNDNRLFIELQVQYMKVPSSNLGRKCCVHKFFLTFRTIFVHNMFSPWSAKRRASDKDLPVQVSIRFIGIC